jgi:glucokinase
MSDLFLAVDFGGTKVEVALAGPGRTVVSRVRLDTEADKGADQVVERALGAARVLLAHEGEQDPRGIGVAPMGYTREDGVDLAPNVPGWESLHLPASLRAAFPHSPVVIDNDVRAAALAELEWGALRGVGTGLYLNLGTGVAATIVVDGRLVIGGHGVAGEVGYWVVPGAGGGRSTLEVEVGGAGVRRRAEAAGLGGGLAGLVASEDPAAAALVDDVFAQVALSVTNMAILIDPERIVLGGGYVGAGSRLLEGIGASLQQHGLFPIEVAVGAFGSDAGLYGAVALAERAGRRDEPSAQVPVGQG